MMAIEEPSLTRRLRRDARSYAANLMPDRDLTRFCILTNGRTGSELLVDLLNSLPHVRCQGEIFHEWHDFPRLFVRGRARGAAHRGFMAYGFKMNTMFLAERFLSLAPRGGVTPLLRQMVSDGFVFMFVRRRNLLRQAVSVLRAQEQHTFHRGSSEPQREERFVADLPDLFATMVSFERHDTMMSLMDVVVSHTVWYEDDLEQPERHQATIDAICTKFGLPTHPCSTRLGRTGRSRLEDDVSNYDELASVMSKTRYAHFLDD